MWTLCYASHEMHMTLKSVCPCVSQSVTQISWTLYRSQSSTNLHKTCLQGRLIRDVSSLFLVEIWKTGSKINLHHWYSGQNLTSNTLKMATNTTMRSMATWPLTTADLRYPRFMSQFLQRGHIACNAECCNSYSNSICPSVTRWYCTQTNEDRIMRSSLWGSKNTLVFRYQQWLGSDVPFHLKFGLKVTNPLEKAPNSTDICL